MNTQNEWTDYELLTVLNLRHSGHSCGQAGSAIGRSKNAVIGMMSRVTSQTDKVACECVKPENINGGMPDGWWRAGLEKQEASQ